MKVHINNCNKYHCKPTYCLPGYKTNIRFYDWWPNKCDWPVTRRMSNQYYPEHSYFKFMQCPLVTKPVWKIEEKCYGTKLHSCVSILMRYRLMTSDLQLFRGCFLSCNALFVTILNDPWKFAENILLVYGIWLVLSYRHIKVILFLTSRFFFFISVYSHSQPSILKFLLLWILNKVGLFLRELSDKSLDVLPFRIPVLSLWHFGSFLDLWC